MKTSAYNEETQAVFNALTGVKTAEQRVCEFFGINAEDLGKTVKLKKAGVQWHPKLAEYGLSMHVFLDMFKDTLEFDSEGKLINDGRNETDAGAGEERGGADEAVGGVETAVKPLKRRKKGDTQEVPGAEPVAQ